MSLIYLMLYGGKPGVAADLANRLAQALAVMAFVPGGVTVFGRHWEANGDARRGMVAP